jgi:long-chain acyl-CoA synthetase
MRFLERIANSTDGDAVALEDGDHVITFAALADAVDLFAVRLQRLGVRRGGRVALVADNSAAYLVVAFAVWRIGATLVTVYPSSTIDELEYVIENSQSTVVLADSRAAERLAGAQVSVDAVVDNETTLGGVRAHPAAPDDLLPRLADLDPDALALICYTSGSTSRPKAVMHSAEGLSAGADAYAAVWRLGPDDRTIVCLPMAWVFGLTTASMSTLSRGGTVLILSRTNPALLLDAISERKGTFLPGVTTMFVKLTEFAENHPDGFDFRSLRFCISGGEPRNEAVFSRWRRLTGVAVHDVFAASECFPVVTYDPAVDPEPRLGSAGTVVPGARMRVVDEKGRDVVPGQAGEALWRAPAHFLGYWDNPEATADATVDGWYRTKDLVTVDEQGYIYVLGRLSDMIIRGGANVSPAEVEGVLAEHDSVRASAVFGRPDPAYGEAVVAAVVARSGESIDADALAEFCRQRLASFKVPTAFIAVDELPVNQRTGKVDRKAVALMSNPVASA